ncbi:3-oxoacyl-(acyl-carrier-protein) synthase [Allocatelliglobosispora scoriae]|uniref:3-oxoacyl-(Acyl-carrier-protein) synthase n=1 Tax=Allocatelliglobosispora scoriae TaxID=643052 RepID=A0A841BJG5_9ACTN|nr:3-oxoacyl-(acyl-carrier-protein) synthase [Allocatelliglobosispora scoriae]
MNDTAEAAVLGRVLAGRHPPVTSAKGVLGHTMGAAGAIEAALTVLAIQHQLVPPTANFTRPGPDTRDLDVVAGAARPHRIELAVSNSFGFGGQNTALAFRSAT